MQKIFFYARYFISRLGLELVGVRLWIGVGFKLTEANLNCDLMYCAYKEKFCALKCRITKKMCYKAGVAGPRLSSRMRLFVYGSMRLFSAGSIFILKIYQVRKLAC